MTIEVQGPDGAIVEFPDGTPPAAMQQAMAQHYGGGSQTPQRTPWNRREQQAVAMDTLRRRTVAGMIPGIGMVVEPIGNMLADPRQRAALGRNAEGFIDQLRQLPSLDLPRLIRDTGAVGQRALNAAPGAIWNAITHPIETVGGVADAMTARPFRENDEARNQEIVTAMRGNEAGANRAAEQAVGSTGGIATNTAGAILGPLARTPLQGATLAAALTAPNALASGEGTLQERLPEALTQTGISAGVGGVLPLLARQGRPRATPPAGTTSQTSPASRLADFEATGVRPTLAATRGGSFAGATKTIAENWPGGLTARAGLRRSIEDTAQAAHRLAAQAGEVQPTELAGEGVQAGIRRFATEELPQPHAGDPRSIPVRDWSFTSKSEALYNRAFDQLERDEAAMTGHVEGPVVTTDNTVGTIDRIASSVRGHESRDMLANPFLQRMRDALSTDNANGSLSFRDLRTWRTRLREMMTDTNMRGDTSSGALRQVYGALTRDITASAQNIGGQAADDLPVIDRWYGRIQRQIDNVLEPFNKMGGGTGGGQQVYRRILALASRGASQNTRQLQTIAARLRPDEMRTVGASLLNEMGNPTVGSAGALDPGAFSVNTFATNWARLSEGGKAALFPNAELRRELESLARVAGYQKQVEAMANHSRTMVSGQNIATAAALTGANAVHQLPLAVAGLGAMNLTGEMLTNPAFVRWLSHSTRTPASGAGVGRSLAVLRRIAARDPAILPAYNRIAQIQRGSAPDQQEQAQPALAQ